MIYVVYKDDGAKGCCGQSVSMTAKKTLLLVLPGYDDLSSVEDAMIKKMNRRKNPRIEELFSDDKSDYMNCVLYFNPKTGQMEPKEA